MENKRPLLLISNDDGYQAPGIHSLVEMLSDYGDILVCAPVASPVLFLLPSPCDCSAGSDERAWRYGHATVRLWIV